jgi:hypothetical protein
MILELAGIVTGGVTVITVASLRFVSLIDKREREQAACDSIEPYAMRPFEATVCDKERGNRCQLCGAVNYGTSGNPGASGPCRPRACPRKDERCPYESHLHVHCDTCGGNYVMATAS